MNSPIFATSFNASLPSWLDQSELEGVAALPTDEDKMRLVHDLADRNHRHGTGGPFAAIVTNTATGELISAGVNVVLSSRISAMHAEIMALSLASTRLGSWDLGATGAPALELIVNWRPCVMCYGATMWSGIKRLVVAGSGPELERLTGFDEGPMHPDWAGEFERRGIEVRQNVLRDEALAVFATYGQRDDVVVYNARGSGAI